MFADASNSSNAYMADTLYVNPRYDPEQEELLRQRQLEMQQQANWDAALNDPLPVSFAGRDSSSVDLIQAVRHDGSYYFFKKQKKVLFSHMYLFVYVRFTTKDFARECNGCTSNRHSRHWLSTYRGLKKKIEIKIV